MENTTDKSRILAALDPFIAALAREVNRVERLKWKASRRSKSKAKINKQAIGRQFQIASFGHSDLDLICGAVSLGLPLEQKADYTDDVRAIVTATIARL